MLGHKYASILCNWPGFDWERVICTPEPMHDFKNTCERWIRLMVGKVVNTGYSSWNKDERHRQQCKLLGVFREVWPENGGALPWRLTKDQRVMLDERMKRVLWPHYVEPLYFKGQSFWQKPGNMWKARRKYRLFLFILPTQIRDQVPRLRDALMLFIWSMRRLMGQHCSFDMATKVLGILPGSPFVLKVMLKPIQRDLIQSLALLEGCGPIDDMKPIEKHFVHYCERTSALSLLRILWMMGFERYNKFLKEHVNNSQHPQINLATNSAHSATSHYYELLEEDKYDLPAEMCQR